MGSCIYQATQNITERSMASFPENEFQFHRNKNTLVPLLDYTFI